MEYLLSKRQSRRLKRDSSTLATSFFLVLVLAIILMHNGPVEKTTIKRSEKLRKEEKIKLEMELE